MSFVPDDWFVRESVTKELNEKIVAISGYVIDNYEDEFIHGDAENAADIVLNAIDQFMDTAEMTQDEMQYVVKNSIDYCAIGYCIRHGVLVETEDGNILLPKGLT